MNDRDVVQAFARMLDVLPAGQREEEILLFTQDLEDLGHSDPAVMMSRAADRANTLRRRAGKSPVPLRLLEPPAPAPSPVRGRERRGARRRGADSDRSARAPGRGVRAALIVVSILAVLEAAAIALLALHLLGAVRLPLLPAPPAQAGAACETASPARCALDGEFFFVPGRGGL